MDFNSGLPRKNTFRRFLLKEVNGGVATARLVELADYEEFLNAPPNIMPEAEVKVQSNDDLRKILAASPSLREGLASSAAAAGGIPKEEALKQLEAAAFWDAPKKGFFARLVGLFK